MDNDVIILIKPYCIIIRIIMIVTKANLQLVEKSPLNLKSQFDSPPQIVQVKVHD